MRNSKYLYWAPRILGVFFVLFLMMFSLDVFEPGVAAWQIALGLFIHNIPAFVLLGLLIVAWKHVIVGAVAFTTAGFLYILMLMTSANFQWYMVAWTLPISGPALVTGMLFWMNRTNTYKSHRNDKMKSYEH